MASKLSSLEKTIKEKSDTITKEENDLSNLKELNKKVVEECAKLKAENQTLQAQCDKLNSSLQEQQSADKKREELKVKDGDRLKVLSEELTSLKAGHSDKDKVINELEEKLSQKVDMVQNVTVFTH